MLGCLVNPQRERVGNGERGKAAAARSARSDLRATEPVIESGWEYKMAVSLARSPFFLHPLSALSRSTPCCPSRLPLPSRTLPPRGSSTTSSPRPTSISASPKGFRSSSLSKPMHPRLAPSPTPAPLNHHLTGPPTTHRRHVRKMRTMKRRRRPAPHIAHPMLHPTNTTLLLNPSTRKRAHPNAPRHTPCA